jgi:hypothetical protein
MAWFPGIVPLSVKEIGTRFQKGRQKIRADFQAARLDNSGQPINNTAPGKTGAQSDEHDIVTGLQHASLHQFVQGDGNRGAGSVSILLNIRANFKTIRASFLKMTKSGFWDNSCTMVA